MFRAMQSLFFPTRVGKTGWLAAAILTMLLSCRLPAPAQPQARRLILKDGSYQPVTKYEIHGDRVRYFSADRGEWEEVPKSLIDWDATNQFEQGRQEGKLAPEAVELDKEIEAERKAEQARAPEIAPGLRLPNEGGIFLLETYENQPQLAELQQSGADVDKNSKSAILHAVINPLAGAKQTIELPGPHAKIQSHTSIPSIFVHLDDNDGAASARTAPGEAPPLPPTERFKIIRIEVKGGKRVAGAVKVAVTGQTKSDERFVAATVTAMIGGWVKLTPADPLAPGEYAVAELLGKEGINLYVWDFGVNPTAPANPFTWKPDSTDSKAPSDAPAEMRKREKPQAENPP